MTEAKHTPAPWKTGDCDGFIIWAAGFRSVKWIECEAGPEAVHIGDATCPGWALRPEIKAQLSIDDLMNREEWIEECRANARLMAAAPDGYDAAEFSAEIVRMLVVQLATFGVEPACNAQGAIERLEGFTAKARGES